MKVTVRLTIQNRRAKVNVVPCAASLIIKAFKEPPNDRKKVKNIKHNGIITIDNIFNSAKIIMPRSMSKILAGVKGQLILKCHFTIMVWVSMCSLRDIQSTKNWGRILDLTLLLSDSEWQKTWA